MTGRPLLLALALLLSAAPLRAADPAPKAATAPKAYLVGPLTSKVGEKILLDPMGSASDGEIDIRVARGPERAAVLPLYTKAGLLSLAVAVPSKAGNYEFVLVAPGATADATEYGFWTVAVADLTPPVPPPQPAPAPGPAPNPPPNPTPNPAPAPVPVVAPIPAATKLIAVAVFTGDATSADELAFAAVRDDPALTAALAALNVQWFAMDRADPRVASSGVAPFLSPAGASPQLLIYDTTKPANIYDADGRVVPRAAGASVKAPLTSAATVALFKKLRGTN